MYDPLEDLNEAQRQAVQHGEGPLMVLAGAGSGKTRVITRRIVHLMREGALPHEILGLTFTNKAAGEMVSRVEALGGHRVHVSTFHSACARFLRRDANLLGYPRNFSIYDTYDRDSCIKLLMREHEVDESLVKPSDVGRRISRLKNLGIEPGEFVAGLSHVDTAIKLLYEPYQVRMKELGAMDFDDLLLRFVDVLQQFPEAAQHYQERFRWLLVDEFQDTNRVQYRLLKLLAGSHENLSVVGDPDQSIYRFRGAEIRNILEFQEDFENTSVIRLETNYRSTGCILAAAQGVIEHNHERMEKELRTEGEFGDLLTCQRLDTGDAEAVDVAERTQGLLSADCDADEIAVFYRAHYLSRGLEQAFRHMGIAYKVVGGLSFFERREIKDLVAYLRVAVNPLDDVSMDRILNVPPRGIGKASARRVRGLARELEMSMVEAVKDPKVREQFKGRQRRGLDQLANLYDKISSETLASDAIGKVLELSGYVEYATTLGDPGDVTRAENIQELLNDAIAYEQEHDHTLPGYLQHVSLLTSEDRQQGTGPSVSFMTVHSAKGLEFDHVFVIGLEEGLFPHMRSIGLERDLEEERRLMYVALTRARKTVFLSHARQRMVMGQSSYQMPSRFLAEIPPGCVQRLDAPWQEFLAEDDDREGDDYPEAVHEGTAVEYDEPEYDINEDPQELRPGDKVIHSVYGPGEVVRVSGKGSKVRAVVVFRDGIERTLLPDYEQFQVVPGGNA